MLEAACLEGGSSLHGTGIHPGFAGDLLPVVLAQISQGVDRIVVSEVADLSRHPSRKFLEGADFGRAISDVEAKPDETLERLTSNFRESLVMLADAMGFPADDFTASHILAAATERATVACGDIEIGTVGGHLREWAVISDGVPKIVFKSCWRVVNGLEPELGVWPDGFVNIKYDIVVDGTPSLRCSFVPSAIKFNGTACDADPGSMARICTAMHAVNTIPQIVNSAPGIVTHLDLLGLRR
jgi:hypothetical protein